MQVEIEKLTPLTDELFEMQVNANMIKHTDSYWLVKTAGMLGFIPNKEEQIKAYNNLLLQAREQGYDFLIVTKKPPEEGA